MTKKISLGDKIFVAGSSGMAGSAICRMLVKSGYGQPKNNGLLLTPKRKELNLLNYSQVNKWFIFHKPKVVILAAGKVGGILANSSQPADFLLENLKIQTNVIEAAWKSGVKRLLFLGSSCIYPKYSKQPIQEDYLLEGELEPTNEPYAIAKISGIKLCESLRKQHGFDALALMPTNLYGPGDNYDPNNSHVMASFIRKFVEAGKNSDKTVECWGSGDPLREFLHVDDLGNACISALEKWNPDDDDAPKDNKGEKLFYLNVGSGEEISIKDLTNKIAFMTGFKGSIIWDRDKPDGTFRKVLDNSRFKFTGWEPKIKLEKGIKEVIKNIEYALNDKSDRGKSLRNFF